MNSSPRASYLTLCQQERQKFLAEERKAMALKQQEDFQKEYAELLAKGESWAMFKAMQNMYKRTIDEQKKRVGDSNTLAGSAGRMAAMMDDLENMEDVQLPMVKIGDASVASPFTSKMPSIKGCVDIIRQVTSIIFFPFPHMDSSIGSMHFSDHHSDVRNFSFKLSDQCVLSLRSPSGWSEIWRSTNDLPRNSDVGFFCDHLSFQTS